jgi:hypothetical protein
MFIYRFNIIHTGKILQNPEQVERSKNRISLSTHVSSSSPLLPTLYLGMVAAFIPGSTAPQMGWGV